MESFCSDNGKNGGYLVYKRENRNSADEESISCASNNVSSNSEASKGQADTIPTPDVGENGFDEGEKLLCCKVCSHTYHLQCVCPPLESMPDGDWLCPNCSDNEDHSEPIVNRFKRDDAQKIVTPKNLSNASSNCSVCSKGKKILNLSKEEVVRSKSSSNDKPNESAEFEESAIVHQGEDMVSDADIFCTFIGQIKCDKLLILREVLQKAIEEDDKPKQNTATMKQLVPEYYEAGQPKKKKSAKPPARKKGEAVKNQSKRPISSSKQNRPKQSSDPHKVKFDESVGLNAFGYNWKGAYAPGSSFNTNIPNPSLHKKKGSAKSKPSSYHKNIDTKSRKPCGFLKLKEDMNDWTELELDALWVCVRRYGQGNWETILKDPVMKMVSKNRTPQELATRWWTKEALKLIPLNSSFDVIGSSLRAPHYNSFQKDHASASFQRVPEILKMQPMVSGPLVQTLVNDQRANLEIKNLGATKRMQPSQTAVEPVSTMRKCCSTSDRVTLLLGGYFPLPKVKVNQNAGDCDLSNAEPMEESGRSSEGTLSG